jgi:hypothetical protein
MQEGHGKPCYYCGEPCNCLHGNPGLWAIPLCHADDPGRVKWHHIRCVTRRLIENGGHEAAARLRIELTEAHNFIIKAGLYDEWAAQKDQAIANLSH